MLIRIGLTRCIALIKSCGGMNNVLLYSQYRTCGVNTLELYIFLAVIVAYGASVFMMRQKVIEYVRLKYANITGMSVAWTLFGPFAPGSGNTKFYVRLSVNNERYLTFYAITSIFGGVYINDQD